MRPSDGKQVNQQEGLPLYEQTACLQKDGASIRQEWASLPELAAKARFGHSRHENKTAIRRSIRRSFKRNFAEMMQNRVLFTEINGVAVVIRWATGAESQLGIRVEGLQLNGVLAFTAMIIMMM